MGGAASTQQAKTCSFKSKQANVQGAPYKAEVESPTSGDEDNREGLDIPCELPPREILSAPHHRRKSSIKIVADAQQAPFKFSSQEDRRISFVLKRESASATDRNPVPPIHEELCERNKVEVLRFATRISLSTDMADILDTVDKSFKRLFSANKVVIHLNPDYAARYQRFLRKHAATKGPAKHQTQNQKQGSAISSLEIGFEEHLSKLCGLRSLGPALQNRKLSSIEDLVPNSATITTGEADDAGQSDWKDEEDSREAEMGMRALGCPIFSLLGSHESTMGEYCKDVMEELEKRRTRSIIAVCEVHREDSSMFYTEEDARLLAALCIHLGQALERACIESDLAKHLEWSRMLLKMSEKLNSNLDAVVLIESAIKMLREALFAERGSIYIVDDTKDPPDLWTMVTGNENDCEELRELRIPFGKGIAGYVAESQEIAMIPDAYQDPRFNPDVDKRTGLKTTSILCVPVFSNTKDFVAVIQMINKKDTEGGWTAAFDTDDVEILKSFSSHVSVALHNAKITAQNKYNEEIANDLLDKMFPKHITEKLKHMNELQALGRGQSADRRTTLGGPHQPIVEKYSKVFVFFSDIVSFTTLSMVWEPYEVVNLLNDLFTQFDYLSAKHHVYKLETIGDAYVACSNLPFMDQESERHAAENLARFAVDATELVKNFVTRSGKKIQIRSGIHCGPCFGGVVGLRMPRYCLMGDTMNTASRMESTGSPGKIHISEEFKLALQNKDGASPIPFSDFVFDDLGTMQVKGKGDMQTYFLRPPDEQKEGFFVKDAASEFTRLTATPEEDIEAADAPRSPFAKAIRRSNISE